MLTDGSGEWGKIGHRYSLIKADTSMALSGKFIQIPKETLREHDQAKLTGFPRVIYRDGAQGGRCR